MDVLRLADEIIGGRRLTRDDDLRGLLFSDIDDLSKGADTVRKALCGDRFDLCSIINGKSGKCSENCRFCAQSAHHSTGIGSYGFLDEDEIIMECRRNHENGVHRFSIVTAGRALSGDDLKKSAAAFRSISQKMPIGLCASHGLLTEEQFVLLKNSGVTRYHCNLETSRRNFPNICTTHTFDDKVKCLKTAKNCGLELCSGGIIGMGETWDDRLDMALTLGELGVSSVPINILSPIKGTPLEAAERVSEDDIRRICAVFRYILPTAQIRLAGGRRQLSDSGRAAFRSGANGAITGDMLTTAGNSAALDIEMVCELGYNV